VTIATGSKYQVNGVDTLTETGLGSAVVSSSLTSVGTLTALEVSGATTLTGGFATNTGTGSMTTTKMLSGTCVLTSVAIGAGAAVDTTCTVTGAALGNAVSLSVNDGTLTADLIFNGWISGADTLTVRVYNLNAASATVTETFGYSVTAFTTA